MVKVVVAVVVVPVVCGAMWKWFVAWEVVVVEGVGGHEGGSCRQQGRS